MHIPALLQPTYVHATPVLSIMYDRAERVAFTVAMTAMQCSCALGFNLLYRAIDMLPYLDRYRVRYWACIVM